MRLLLVLLVLGIAVGVARAQQPPPAPQDEVAKLQWHVRQLQGSRAQCEENVSVLGMQLDKAQKELAALKAKAARPEAKEESH